MKILMAVDGSPFTDKMLRYVVANASWLVRGNELTALTVIPPVPPRAASALDHQLLQSYYDDEAEKVFAPLRTAFESQGIAVQFLPRTGHAAEVIAKTADTGGFELLVMGSHGHGALGKLVMGSVTAKVLAHCGTPALLIR
jgi:nucleotide-binding universal stress UspA family protein